MSAGCSMVTHIWSYYLLFITACTIQCIQQVTQALCDVFFQMSEWRIQQLWRLHRRQRMSWVCDYWTPVAYNAVKWNVLLFDSSLSSQRDLLAQMEETCENSVVQSLGTPGEDAHNLQRYTYVTSNVTECQSINQSINDHVRTSFLRWWRMLELCNLKIFLSSRQHAVLIHSSLKKICIPVNIGASRERLKSNWSFKSASFSSSNIFPTLGREEHWNSNAGSCAMTKNIT